MIRNLPEVMEITQILSEIIENNVDSARHDRKYIRNDGKLQEVYHNKIIVNPAEIKENNSKPSRNNRKWSRICQK